MSVLIEDGATVLFQGDSITDAGRSYWNEQDLGAGYAMVAAAWFSALYPEKGVRFINRAYSGSRVVNLRECWQEDCLALRPDWVSLLIGVNDTWRRYDRNDPTSAKDFEAAYRAILRDATEQLQARLILCEPFLLPTSPDLLSWREDLEPKIAVVRQLAHEFNAILVPFDGLFAQALARGPATFWAGDGIHPSLAGHGLMAQAWLKAVGAI